MATVTIEEHRDLGVGIVPIAIVDPAGLVVTKVTPTAVAASHTIGFDAKAVTIVAEDANIRIDIGSSVTATSSSRLVFAGTSATYAIEHDGPITVSYILA